MSDVDLKTEQAKTLSSSRRNYGFLSRILFFMMDVFYGRQKSLPKCMVLEIIARVPYQAWEQVAYIAMTQTFPKPVFARRVFNYVLETRHQQDNEQWHMFILEEMLSKETILRGPIKFFLIPQFIAF